MSEVSVIIPIFNSVQTLERAINSLVFDEVVSEIFIVDDGSTDGSLELAQHFAEKFKIIQVLQHSNGQNRGACASRNLGLAHAQSDWIQFLDADDELLAGKIKGQLELATSNVAFVVGNSIHVFPDGRRHNRKSDKDLWKGLIRSNLGTTSSILWNRKMIVEVGGWDEQLQSSQEYDLIFRLFKVRNNVVFDNRHMTLIHQTRNSISRSPMKKEIRIYNWLKLRESIRDYLVDNDKFGLKNQYYWSGALGSFCEETNISFHPQIDRFLFSVYKKELYVRRLGFKIKSFLKKPNFIK